MRRIALLVAMALSLTAVRAHAEDAQFKPLFNGSSLEGWTGDPELWSVADGMIVGTTDNKDIGANSFLATDKTYKNFVVRLKFKLRNGNSGVQYRSTLHDNYRVTGYQADIADVRYMGILYEEGGRGILADVKPDEVDKVVKKDDWNTYVITADGANLKHELNGVTTIEYKEEDEVGAEEGVIALQLHVGPKMRIEFKDLEIQELP